MKRTKVLYIISGLGGGGAEKMLFQLVSNIDKNLFDVSVISLSPGGYYSKQIKLLNIRCYELNLKSYSFLREVGDLIKLIRQIKPDILHTWMYHADFIGGIIGYLCGINNIFWGIRNSNLSLRNSSPITICIFCVNAILSYFIPKKIINCSLASIRIHRRYGYCPRKFRFIPNGLDFTKFNTRASFDWENRKYDVFFVGRYNPQKNIEGFLQVISMLKKKNLDVNVGMLGIGMTEKNAELTRQIERFGLKNNITLFGFDPNIQLLIANTKCVLSMAKYGEAFPNIIIEAMVLGAIPIAADIGDTKKIIGNEDLVFDISNNYDDVVQKVYNVLNLSAERAQYLSDELVHIVKKEYNLLNIVLNYQKEYETMMNEKS